MNKEKVVKVSYMGPGHHNMKEHLCFDCKNGCPSKCPKIADFEKKSIEEYPFILDGKQTFDKNGDIDRFIVYDCKNFEKVPYNAKKLTPEEKRHISELKTKMITCYFDVDTVREANDIQFSLYQKGLLELKKGQLLATNAKARKFEENELFDEQYSSYQRRKF